VESDWPPSDEDPFDFDTGERPGDREEEPVTGAYERLLQRRQAETGEEPAAPAEDPFPLDTDEARRRAGQRGDPFDTGEYRARRARRTRRDLPARIRRRQVIAVLGLAAVLAIGLYVVAFSGGSDSPEEEQPFPLRKLVGQTIVGTLGEDGADKQLLQRVERGWIGGVVVVSDNVGQLRNDVRKLRRAAQRGDNPPVLVMADQEGGHVKRVPGPPDLFPDEIAEQGADAAQAEGEKTGASLRNLGINVELAPVIDVAHPQTEETIASRTYTDDAEDVGALGAAFITGVQSQGVAATAKHFPGMGLATQNTDFDVVTVASTEQELREEIEPFQQAIAAGVELIMVSTAIYPDLSEDSPAAFSRAVVQRELRRRLGFEGVIITDDLEAPGSGRPPGDAAVRAIRAGVDLAMFATSDGAARRAQRALVKAISDGRLDRDVVQRAYDRVLELKNRLSGAGQGSSE
jgi:beta-N-acetylhexosaminidase